MTNRERVNSILHYRAVDRMPAVHFGYWRELLDEWAEQGHVPADIAREWRDGNEADRKLDALVGWDFNWSRNARGVNMSLSPSFEKKVLEVLPDGTQRIQNSSGLIERIKPGIGSIPSEDDYQLKTREDFEKLYAPKMQFDPARINFDVFRNLNETRDADLPISLNFGSILGTIRNMTSVLGLSYLLYDEDETLLSDIVDTYAEMQYQCIKAILETGAKFDYAHGWEDICFKSGPLISPTDFERLCAKHYKKRTDLLHQYGIDIISIDCDGVVEQLIPIWLANGVNTLFPIEVGVWGDQFEPARKKYGETLRGVGAMDKTAFRKDKAAVDAELDRIQKLANLGGFIPCPDHRIMPGSKFELVQYYAHEIKKIKL